MSEPSHPDSESGRTHRVNRFRLAWIGLVLLAVAGLALSAFALQAQRRADSDTLGRLDRAMTRTTVMPPAAPVATTTTDRPTTTSDDDHSDDSHHDESDRRPDHDDD